MCQKTQVSYCYKFETFNTCKECFSGYYLSAGKCMRNPIDSVPYCDEYVSLTECSRCINGFNLIDSVCVPVKPVKHCVQYDGSNPENWCFECEVGFFVSGKTRCLERKNTEVMDCLEYDPASDSCLTCNSFYMRVDRGLKCLEIIDNCRIYVPMRMNDESLTCHLCSTGYFLSGEGVCEQGAVENCEEYQARSGKCMMCVHKFYLKNSTCLPHETIDGCVEYHPLLKNSCSHCNFDRQRLTKLNECQQVAPITHCKEYASHSRCRECEDLFYLVGEACELIPPSENCMQRHGPLCGKCLPDFNLVEGVCKDPLDYIVLHCEEDNIQGETDYNESKCFTCQQNAVPVNYRDSFVCVEQDYMAHLTGGTMLDHCLQYVHDPFSKQHVCTKCASGFVLDQGACVQTCPPSKTLYMQTLKQFNADGDDIEETLAVERTLECGPALPNCKAAAPSLSQKTLLEKIVRYECVECLDNKLPVVEFNAHATMFRLRQRNLEFSPVASFPGVECVNLNLQILLGELNGNSDGILNCDYYVQIGEIFACTKCTHGHHGIVVDFIHKCARYESQSRCLECQPGFYLRSPYECKAVEEVTFCIEYITDVNITQCTRCENEYFLASDVVCSPRVDSLSVSDCDLDLGSDTCNCQEGFKLDDALSPHRCIAKPPYCVDGDVNGNVVDCTDCDDSVSFRQGTICMEGSAGCATYALTTNTCETCPNGRYKQNGGCVAHQHIDSCETYSQDVENECTECNSTSILFDLKNKCALVNPITDCEEYNSVTTCARCANGTRVQNIATTCYPIPVEDHCLVQVPIHHTDSNFYDEEDFDSTSSFVYTCDVCEENYYRIAESVTVTWKSDNATENIDVYKCYDYLSIIINHCAKSNIDGQIGLSAGSCLACDEGYYSLFVQYYGTNQCFRKEYLNSKKSVVGIDNCRLLDNTSGNDYVCIECEYPFKLESGLCVEEC